MNVILLKGCFAGWVGSMSMSVNECEEKTKRMTLLFAYSCLGSNENQPDLVNG